MTMDSDGGRITHVFGDCREHMSILHSPLVEANKTTKYTNTVYDKKTQTKRIQVRYGAGSV